MRILVVGGGGREHALAWKLSQEAEVFAAPGNPGMAEFAEIVNVAASAHEALIEAAKERSIDLVVVGPEDPLIAGLADDFRSAGFAVVGPNAEGAQHESSKAFSKAMMQRAGVPTAEHLSFTDLSLATEYAKTRFDAGRKAVIKASGAALGKGVTVCDTFEEASEALEMMFGGGLGEAGKTVVVEDRLTGQEFSLLALVNEVDARALPVAQDHKRAFDGDLGPNTGGMGTFSPVDWLNNDIVEESMAQIVKPIMQQMQTEGISYRGVLFAGIMVCDGRPFCLEYNVRFGDPETQSVMRRLGDGFAESLADTARGRRISALDVYKHASATVILASGGYPGAVQKGFEIQIGDLDKDIVVFHSGTAIKDGKLVTNGGRVLGVSAIGESVEAASSKAYEACEQIKFEGMMLRRDIGRVQKS